METYRGELTITYNDHEVTDCLVLSASSLVGWIEVVDNAQRYPGGDMFLFNKTRTDFIRRRLWGDVHVTYQGRKINLYSIFAFHNGEPMR